MNNSTITLESEPLTEEDILAPYQEREAKLVNILEAINELESTKSWRTLKTEVFDGLNLNLEKDLKEEARQENPSTTKLSRIAGELKWAERFSDLKKFSERYRVELKAVRSKLQSYDKSVR